MKHEWRKREKDFYFPKNEPEIVTIPEFKFFTIEGGGNPNDPYFAEYIGVLYSVSYAIKMSPRTGLVPDGYFDYTVYPLEGVWDLNEEAKKTYDGTLDKNDLVFTLMIRQPDFVDDSFAQLILERTENKKPHELLKKVKFQKIQDGTCVQMMHLGSYDTEPESFKRMEDFTSGAKLFRMSKVHREIYLSDVRKVAPHKLKTVLRFQVGNA